MQTFGEAVDLYVRRPGPPLGPTTLGIAMRLRSTMGKLPITKVDQSALDLYVKQVHARSKPGTIKRELTVAQTILNAAARRGWCKEWRIEKPSVDDARMRWLDTHEVDALVSCAPAWFADLLEVLFNTGVRLGEALSLTWTEVSATNDAITVCTRKGKAKVRRYRTIPLNVKARAAIDSCAHRTGRTGFVFVDEHGRKLNRFMLSKLLSRVVSPAAGIANFRLHDCRHTFASHLVRKGVSMRVVADLLGHTNINMVMRYAHLAPAQHKAAVELLD